MSKSEINFVLYSTCRNSYLGRFDHNLMVYNLLFIYAHIITNRKGQLQHWWPSRLDKFVLHVKALQCFGRFQVWGSEVSLQSFTMARITYGMHLRFPLGQFSPGIGEVRPRSFIS